jgi:hypothetical protein
MAQITRASLPSEFFDITSNMLLVQPQPQFLHAQLWKLALQASLSPPSALGMAGRTSGASGDGVGGVEVDRLMMEDDGLASSTITVVPSLGNGPGHTVNLNRPVFASTTYTQASRLVPSGTDISTSAVNISAEQVPVTLQRFAGPYNSGISAPGPYALDRFDAKLSIHSLAALVGKHMKQDFDKTLDSFMVTLLDLASSTVRPLGFSADADFTTQEAGPMDFNTIARVERAMDEANIPVFANGRRILCIHPRQAQSLKDDPQFARYAESHAPVNPLLKQSYLKSVAGFDIYKSNALDTDTNASSVVVYKAQAWGPGVLGSAIGEMPRVTAAAEDNYGETAKVVWLLYGAFAMLDNRFAVSVRTS